MIPSLGRLFAASNVQKNTFLFDLECCGQCAWMLPFPLRVCFAILRPKDYVALTKGFPSGFPFLFFATLLSCQRTVFSEFLERVRFQSKRML